jgi:hypothetical protein
MSTAPVDRSPLQSPLSRLELALIDEFVRARGYDPLKLSEVPEQERTTLLKEASLYASVKLSEVESRSHFVDEIHNGIHGASKTGL